MPTKITNDEGVEVEYFTVEEVSAKETELQNAVTAAEEAKQKYDKLEALHTSQADNFKRYKDMTEEEKSTLSAEKVETLKRLDSVAAEAEAANLKLQQMEDAQAAQKTEQLLTKYTGKDEALRKTFKEKFDTLTSVPDMEDRALATAALIGINTGSAPQGSPFHQQFSGEAPAVKSAETAEFLSSDKGKAGMRMMGYDDEGKLIS